jgi:DNA-binding transcriptional ArsR family regulator
MRTGRDRPARYAGGIRPPTHPDIEQVSVAEILHALSDPIRVAIVVELLKDEASCVAALSKTELDIPKATSSRHFRVLRDAGLVRAERRGVELVNRVRFRELESRFPGLLRTILKSYALSQQRAPSKKQKSRA